MASVYLTLFSLTVVVFLGLQHGAHGDGTIKVRFDRYENPGGLGSNGHCCDGKWGACQSNGCDHKFTVCLSAQAHEDSVNTDLCEYGLQESSEIENQNTIDFGDSFGSVENPMSFDIVGDIPSSFQLMVDVWDEDNWFSDDRVEFLAGEVRFPADSKTSSPVVLEGRTRLDATVWKECAQSYYGGQCQTLCPGPRPEDNYYCDQDTGEKRCNTGWTGANCKISAATTTTASPSGRFDCDEWARAGSDQDGVYELSPLGLSPFSAWCDMDSKGEGWIVIQRRNGDSDQLTDFNRDWEAYREGFGDVGMTSEFWLGLEKIHSLTSQKKMALHINMEIGNGDNRWARYDRFWVENEADGYRLHLGAYSGDAGDAMNFLGLNGTRYQNAQAFSTSDTDNDRWSDGSCAQIYKSGWWFNDCAFANLNGEYNRPVDGWPPCQGSKCLAWRTIEGYEFYSLIATEMRIRPNPRDQ